MKWIALAMLLFGIFLVKRALGSKASFDDGSFLGAIVFGGFGVVLIAVALLILLILLFVAL